MGRKPIVIVTGCKIGKLEVRWNWYNGVEHIWKCQCECGNICYVKEKALLEHIVSDCGKCGKPDEL